MKEFIVFTILGLSSLLTAIGGPINSDPAPGRSPGPPPLITTNDVFIDDKDDGGGGGAGGDGISNDVTSKESNIIKSTNVHLKSFDGSLTSSSTAASSSSSSSSPKSGLLRYDSSSSSSSVPQNLTTSSSSSTSSLSVKCLAKFLSGNEKIVKVKNSDANSLHLDVTHDAFTTENGLIPNFMYLVTLSFPKDIQPNNFYVETLFQNEAWGSFSSHRSTSTRHNSVNSWSEKELDPTSIRYNSAESYPATVNNNQKLPLKSSSPNESNDWETFDWNDSVESVDNNDDDDDDDDIETIVAKNSEQIVETSGKNRVKCFPNVWTDKWQIIASDDETRSDKSSKSMSMNWTLSDFNFNELSDKLKDTLYFRILYRTFNSPTTVYEIAFPFLLSKECKLYLKHPIGYLDNTQLPVQYNNCTVNFPSREDKSSIEPYGLLIQLTRLNVPCRDDRGGGGGGPGRRRGGGYVHFINSTQYLCGKFEELPINDRTYYFTSTTKYYENSDSSDENSHNNNNNNINSDDIISVTLLKAPLFSLNYKLVDYCYNLTLKSKNSSFFLRPTKELECYFKVHLPYGNRILLNLVTNFNSNRVHNSSSSSSSSTVNSLGMNDNEIIDLNFEKQQILQQQQQQAQHHSQQTKLLHHDNAIDAAAANIKKCNGIFIELIQYKWFYCVDNFAEKKNFTFLSSDNVLVIRVTKLPSSLSSTTSASSFSEAPSSSSSSIIDVPSLHLEYIAQSIESIVSQCAFGWIAFRQFCISTVENVPMTWQQAESECIDRGGHLASIRSEHEQTIVDQLLMNSPEYREHNAYWVGASDKYFEGDFRWSDGLPFSYSNWFTGWAQHGHYNRQPNDDGLSGQDCVEIRRHFRVPPGGPPTPTPLSSSYRWNDRDCNAKNYFLCERPMTDEPEDKMWSSDCNKTIVLTREHPRTSIWSSDFPRQYPDNTNCLTIITAPEGYRIILDFEELVLENEQSCSYDYLEIFESPKSGSAQPSNQNSQRPTSSSSQHHSNKKRNYYPTASASLKTDGAQQSPSSSSSSVSINYETFLNSNKFHSNIILPSTPRGLTNVDFKRQTRGNGPRKICGDWSSTLKLLRYVTQSPTLGLHFVSDYSHRYGGYKAKVAMENVASECADERLKPYNGSCYLFIGFPRVSWWTAQQVCRSIGSQLASISSADEQKFVTTNIRNHFDYMPRALYWLGGELAENNAFEWTDGSDMVFEGWLPGQEIATVEALKETTCLALQFQISPTPMLPSGHYWTPQKCSSTGGYVCRGKQHSNLEVFIKNKTITGSEGRLTTPGYPNAYPSNLDYWIRIIGPKRSRLIIQFQKIDLEFQDECLYDYVSARNYDPIIDSELQPSTSSSANKNNNKLDPGTNPIPMAMFQHESFYIDYQNDNPTSMNQKSRHDDDEDVEDFLQSEVEPNRKNMKRTLRHKYKRSIVTEEEERRVKRFLNSQYDFRSTNAVKNYTQEHTPTFLPYVRWCGAHDSNMSKYDYISDTNQAILHFHSDFSNAGSGFSATWMAIDVSGCPLQTLTAREGTLKSPNYPHFLLNNLECTFLIQAPPGKKVWLQIQDYQLLDDYQFVMDLGDGEFTPFGVENHLNDGVFVSQKEKLRLRLQTGKAPKGRGFEMIYKTLNPVVGRRTITFVNNTHGTILHLNYPKSLSGDVEFTQNLIAPMGENILLELHGVELSDTSCKDGNEIEIYDNYTDNNGTVWYFCNETYSSEHFRAPIYITSYLNSLHIKQKTSLAQGIQLNATVKIQEDANFKTKLAKGDDWVESCETDPCLYSGKCVSSGDKHACQCRGHYVGRFCGLTMCETDPCQFGKCELTATGFKCHCQPGYIGKTCDQRQKPCTDNPCEGRGECLEKNGGFICRCYAWWEGHRCERRMINIRYKPLTERMLQEPFWLGLITVFIVLAIIGLVWCAKRHFPEKIEKLLSEEADRTRPFHSHHPSLREQLQFTSAVQQNAATTPAASRTIFGRLGIRKPSILSLSSPQPSGGATARTFSLDDLLRPPPRRTPSPRKKRNNSTPTKKNAAEKKQILQQLISPAAQSRPKVTLGELIQLSENRLRVTGVDSESDMKETTFSENSCSVTASVTRPMSDPKFEKKVTFARLLNKVSAEISSGSELDIGLHMNRNSSALSLPVDIPPRANSVPPSPCQNDMRSPHSTSSNPGSDSLSSSELALTEFSLRNNRRTRPKVSSADSILAMFKSFANSNLSPQATKFIISPSTTPTACSPQDDAGDDDSSTSSIHTPVSFSSGAPDSPVFYRQSTIEVPVLDPLSAHKNSPTNSGLLHPPTILLEIPRDNNSLKCLSPIREMPTPMPSPAITPIMGHRRPQSPGSPLPCNEDNDLKDFDYGGQRKRPNLIINLQPCHNYHDSEMEKSTTDMTSTSDESNSVYKPKPRLNMRPPAISIDIDPPTPTEAPERELVIPTLIIEQPSPTRDRSQVIMFPGSPPPQRASIGETSFAFPSKQQQKRLLKQFEKPTSLDLQFAPPMITVTSNLSEIESDGDGISPAQGKTASNHHKLLMPSNNVGMCYLSPFSICTRGDRTISDSNLSSSGYSSMASPGPSRCGSNNPLCPSETDDPGTGHGLSFHAALTLRRQNPMLKTCQEGNSEGNGSGSGGNSGSTHNSSQDIHGGGKKVRHVSDSETTLSDDHLLESNDEGIGTDHLEEKNDDRGDLVNSAKNLELYIGKELLDSGRSLLNPETEATSATTTTISMSQLKLPSIVIQSDEKGISPVSSRSESPLSERTGMGRFSPLFYGKKERELPFTDSDGLYDFPSSDGKGNSVTLHQRKSSCKRRGDRKSSRAGLQHSPSKTSVHLEIPGKENPNHHHNHHHQNSKHFHHASSHMSTTRKSPKRRPIQRHPVASSSSSSENLTSTREINHRSKVYLPGPSKVEYGTAQLESKNPRLSRNGSEDDTEEDVSSQILPKTSGNELAMRPQRKLGRLRAIGNQIRFLRRLEQSIKQRDRQLLSSPDDDGHDGADSSHVTSPLLQPSLPNIATTTSTKTPRPMTLKVTRQKRVTCHPSDKIWREREKGLIHGDINSD